MRYPTDQPTDIASYRRAMAHVKTSMRLGRDNVSEVSIIAQNWDNG